jgi:hypothetical protein
MRGVPRRSFALVPALLASCSDYELNKGEDDPGVEPVECALAVEAGAVDPDPACVVDAEPGTFNPVVEWQWSTNSIFPGYDDIMSTPAVGNLTDDNGDGSIDEGDVPDVVFTTFAGGAYTSPGVLNAISGDGGAMLWAVDAPGGYPVHSSGSPAIGDLDRDGIPEVCTPGATIGVVCLEADGSFRWAGGTEIYGYGSPALADLDADGSAEVVFGRGVLDTDGTVLWTAGYGAGWWLSFAADLDDDGVQEVVTGNTVYNVDGTLRWSDGTTDGPGAVGDFDLDGTPEVVHVGGGTVHVTNADGSVRWQTAVPGGGGGAPTVADFDNDGLPEIGVAGAYYYSVFDTDGAVAWSASVQDYSSSVTGSSVFDFEGDGAADVVYADEVTLWVYDGATGAVKLRVDEHASGTLLEYPLIVDVDHDGVTEIVLASNNYAFEGWNGITVIGDADGSWRPSRPTWNQFAYSITNIGDDGSIPPHPSPNWLRYNNFRAGGTTLGLTDELANLQPAAPELCTLECAAGNVLLTIPVRNVGTADSAEFAVTLGNADGSAVLTSTSLALDAGAVQELGPFEVRRRDWEGANLWVHVDVGDAVEECGEADNSLDLGPWPCE